MMADKVDYLRQHYPLYVESEWELEIKFRRGLKQFDWVRERMPRARWLPWC